MKRFFYLLSFAALLTACGGPEGEALESEDAMDAAGGTTETLASAEYTVDPNASVINWEGAKIAYSHVGTVPVSDGQLIVANDNIVGGKFTIDLRQIENTDIEEGEKRDKLVGHLKSPDFFDVATHPMAAFEIVRVEQVADSPDNLTHRLTGNLTMRGQSRAITIPATVSLEGDMLKATTPKFTIDRTEWGVDYNNSNLVDLAKDEIINDNIGLQIALVARK